MTLQERILEALDKHALPSKALYQSFSSDPANAVEAAIRGLMKAGEVGDMRRRRFRSSKIVPCRVCESPYRLCTLSARLWCEGCERDFKDVRLALMARQVRAA